MKHPVENKLINNSLLIVLANEMLVLVVENLF